jgi:hypothetical protein
MRKTTFFFLLLFLIGKSSYGSSNDEFFRKTDSFLKKYVSDGSVAYKAIRQNSTGIEALYREIGGIDLASFSDSEKKAFYINAYNIAVIYQVVKYYPLKSPLDHSGFFNQVKHKVAGQNLTLDELEMKKLLQPYGDARIHFALACAAKSCPPLASFAFVPEKLDQQLTERTMLSVNSRDWLKINHKEKRIGLSKIFDWYKKDFGTSEKSVLDWVNQYRKEKIPSDYSVGYYDYNWALNE